MYDHFQWVCRRWHVKMACQTQYAHLFCPGQKRANHHHKLHCYCLELAVGFWPEILWCGEHSKDILKHAYKCSLKTVGCMSYWMTYGLNHVCVIKYNIDYYASWRWLAYHIYSVSVKHSTQEPWCVFNVQSSCNVKKLISHKMCPNTCCSSQCLWTMKTRDSGSIACWVTGLHCKLPAYFLLPVVQKWMSSMNTLGERVCF